MLLSVILIIGDYVYEQWKTRQGSGTIICDLLVMPNGEGNGTPLQYSCLENPMDGVAW